MSERLSAAIEELEEHLAQQQSEVADTKKMINSLRKRMNLEPLYIDVSVESAGSIRPDQYYGKPLATAASDFLERRKRACSADEILKGLLEGGFDFEAIEWKEKDRLRLLSSSLAKNNTKFHRLPQGQFGLLDWYDFSAVKRTAKERKQNGSADAADPADSGVAGVEEGEKALA